MAAALAALVLPLSSWFVSVSSAVRGPYLDEIFHVRQAQHYCAGDWHVWDPKITTPPGLYLISVIAHSLRLPCSIDALRAASALCLPLLFLLLSWTSAARNSSHSHHHAINLVLFPPLFFFAALYYTDVASTASVVLFHWAFLKFQASSAWLRNPLLTLIGSFSLLFRQTNIFWIAIFPAGLTLVRELDHGHIAIKQSMARGSEGFGDTLYNIAKTSWKMNVVYEASIANAWLEDYPKTIISLATCAIKIVSSQPRRLFDLILALAPFLTLISLFGGFIFWNEGVVLGDRTNHVATLHLPQMLYLWPYITFFSWPQLYYYLLLIPLSFFAKIPAAAPQEALLIFKRRSQDLLPRLWLLALFTLLASVVVWTNTIVHPFTLADNRHYTFYVFRLLLRRSWVRYAVTPIYVFCAHVCIQALGGGQSRASSRMKGLAGTGRRLALPNGENPATTVFVLIWLMTTALQLVTAPLVEPRYFILPWIFWRMHLPPSAKTLARDTSAKGRSGGAPALEIDMRLYLETAWLLLVNAATGYIFLNWTFTWPQEPGQLQRFMW